MDGADFEALDAILDTLRQGDEETPQWEFCEGFMAALVCCRRKIAPREYLPVLLALPDAEADADADPQRGGFVDDAQFERFMALWNRRWNEIAVALDSDVEDLQDGRAYQPELLDTRGAIAALPEQERQVMQGQVLPAFAQVWALGFMYAVENWPEEWAAPRDRKTARLLDESMEAILALTEDDSDPPAIAVYEADGLPSVSRQRIDALGKALWAVYDLRDLWRSLGPRVETVHSAAKPGRNDPCHCGSGKKFKKCHGAG